jgi:hypothetical protein
VPTGPRVGSFGGFLLDAHGTRELTTLRLRSICPGDATAMQLGLTGSRRQILCERSDSMKRPKPIASRHLRIGGRLAAKSDTLRRTRKEQSR